MTTKIITLRAIDLIQGLGNDRDGIPLRWLASLTDKVRGIVPDDEEPTCKVHGAAALTFTYTHAMTEVEQLQATIDDHRRMAAQIKALLPRDGALSETATAQLRELLR